MILLDAREKLLRCRSAFIANVHDEERLCNVSTRDEVLAFLKDHPDRHFFLVHGTTAGEVNKSDEQNAVFCGLVKFVSKEGVLVNKRFSFRS
jgi:hypothetical protein